MLHRCEELIRTYGSQELNMPELRHIEKSGLVSFENMGISRSDTDCLLCVVTFTDLARFKHELLSCRFDSFERYEKFIADSGFTLHKEVSEDKTYVTHKSESGFYEIACSIEEDGRVEIDCDEIRLHECFNIYLRVQH